ncbi:transmembrane cytochrome oxidase [Limnohabitans sp. T6-5]|uniref:SURF1 family protein n=1 Tax=Limnohabitans sp. T6-5 TaxID=1100724 RepID=UPI000D3D456A|nr:SURF1 family protein [Limnohabitans sp. T6-5]PUE09213.1 transmembrane cytochrome oxidase [Limnohabitans sp. T6-5]
MSERTALWQRVLILILSILGMAITVYLGIWQLGRGAQKVALQESKQQQAALAPLDGLSLGSASDSVDNRRGMIYRKFQIQGHWLNKHTVYLENRQMHGRPGFFVMTPFKLLQSDVVILVQRGWAPRSFSDRAALPNIATPNEEVRIQGHLAPWPSRLYDFGGEEVGQIRQNLDFAQYKLQSALPLLEVSLLQDGPASEGLLRDWPAPVNGAEKHQGYAFQWFGLSVLIALLYVWFQIVQPRRSKKVV